MCCDVVEAVGAVLHACGVLVCCRDRTNGARGAPNRSVMRDLERSCSKTGLGRSGHDRSQSFGPIWHVSGPEMVF